MPGQRRDTELFGIITRTEFATILEKARKGLGSGSELGYVREPENAIRDAGLLAWEYLSGKRVSEFVGRKFYDDLYIGLTMDKWKLNKVAGVDVLQFYVRILKRGKRKKVCSSCQVLNPAGNKFCKACGANLMQASYDSHLMEVWKWKNIRLDDPFTTYILEWLNLLKGKNYQGRIFAISRQHAWRIMKNLGIMNHINRHWRATHQSTTMNAFELKEFLDRATVPTEYVHSNPKKQLSETEEADKIWQ